MVARRLSRRRRWWDWSRSGRRPRRVEPPDSDPTALLEKFVPVVAEREHDEACSEEGDPYRPLSVDNVLGRDDVVLRDDKGVEVKRAPTAADLAAAGEEWALDLPGDALSPGCTYEQWEASFGADPVVYGRVVRDRGKVIAQYWMYYVYNDWNDRHESDWEMIQLVFDAPTVAEAMAKGPALYAYAQHEGSQYVMPEDVEGLDVSSTGDDVHLVGTPRSCSPARDRMRRTSSGPTSSARARPRASAATTRRRRSCRSTPRSSCCPPRRRPMASWRGCRIPAGGVRRSRSSTTGRPDPSPRTSGPTRSAGSKRRADPPPSTSRSVGPRRHEAFCDVSRTASLFFIRLLDNPLQLTLVTIAVVVVAIVLIRYAGRGLFSAAVRTFRAQPWRILLIGSLFLVGALISYLLRLLLQIDALSDDSAFGEDTELGLVRDRRRSPVSSASRSQRG